MTDIVFLNKETKKLLGQKVINNKQQLSKATFAAAEFNPPHFKSQAVFEARVAW